METIKGLDFLQTLLPLALVVFIIGIGVVLLNLHFQRNLFSQKIKEEALERKHRHDLLRSSIHAEEQERKRMAQDLHDELGAVLSIMRMNTVMLEQQNQEAGDNTLAGLQNLRQLAETAMISVRNISHQLMPPQMEAFGLIKTLESVIDQINTAGKIYIELMAPADLANLSWEINLGLYRIIMELTNNTLKHAHASHITIEISCDSKFLVCRYRDNGIGLMNKGMHDGLGHKSIYGRVTALEGTFELEIMEVNGFSAIIRIPLPAA